MVGDSGSSPEPSLLVHEPNNAVVNTANDTIINCKNLMIVDFWVSITETSRYVSAAKLTQ